MKYIIGTRGSKLALTQTNYVCDKLQKAYPEDEFEIKVISTKGDQIQNIPLNQIGTKGLFVKEIEDQLLDGQVHIGVHSMKDMPAFPEKGLTFTKSWEREDPRDVLVLREKKHWEELPNGAVIGTGSARRKYQLLQLRPDLQVVDIRGNVDTRLRKMNEQKLDGIVLAAAGLKRLGMESVITQYLESDEMISAPAQGILALEVKEDNVELIAKLNALSDEKTAKEAEAERGFLAGMGADCHTPVGAICKATGDEFCLKTIFGNEEGTKLEKVVLTGENPSELAAQAVVEMRRRIAGTVYLIGAGPGDPGLITVKGLEAIQNADCIVYDRLASPELLESTKADCEKIYVGKANHNHTMVQDDINQLLVDMAMKYQNVVRLKGGDVYVFGRGGEEGIFLKEHGVNFEVVPGISSSIAGLAYAGIPITHRGIATGFHVLTAHNKRDELADIDFDAIAASEDTTVFLMGLSKTGEIASKLMKAGMPETTKIAVISHATTAQQKTCIATLQNIEEEIKRSQITSPALIVVGNVIELREYLNFFEQKPLFGQKYLVPKIGKATSPLAKMLRREGAKVDELTVGQIQYKEEVFTKEEIQKVNWMIFTSRHGVKGFFQNLYRSNLDIRCLGTTQIAAIGSATADLLKEYGIIADLIPETYNSDTFGETLLQNVQSEDIVWYLKGANLDGEWMEKLNQVCLLEKKVMYENKPEVFETSIETSTATSIIEDLETYDAIFMTCGSSAKRLLGQQPKEVIEQLNKQKSCISIGKKCSSVLEEIGISNYRESKVSTYQGMRNLMIESKTE